MPQFNLNSNFLSFGTFFGSAFNNFGTTFGQDMGVASLFSNGIFSSNMNIGQTDYLSNIFAGVNQNLFSQTFRFDSNERPLACNYNFGSFGTNVRSSRVTLTSSKVQNALNVAKSQIGVSELGSSNNSADVNKYRGGVANGNPWCASFVSWCYGRGQNNNNAKTFGYDASTQSIRKKAEKAGHYASKNSNYQPQVGDLAMWKYSETSGHIGIISKVNRDGSFEVVEGNCGNKVQKVTRSRASEGFHGFVKMNEWLQA